MEVWCVRFAASERQEVSVVMQSSINVSGAIMSRNSVIPVINNAKPRKDLIERGFSRQPVRIDVDIALGSVIPCGLVHSKGQIL